MNRRVNPEDQEGNLEGEANKILIEYTKQVLVPITTTILQCSWHDLGLLTGAPLMSDR